MTKFRALLRCEMSEKRLCDYVVVSGFQPAIRSKLSTSGSSSSGNSLFRRPDHDRCPGAPITDICVINTSLDEEVPEGWVCIEKTQFDFPANLNHGSLTSYSMFLCYRRGFDRQPLVDIGVVYDARENVLGDSQLIKQTPYRTSANVNNSSSNIYLTYRRAKTQPYYNQLVVTDICVILLNKGETPPPAFCKIDKNLNRVRISISRNSIFEIKINLTFLFHFFNITINKGFTRKQRLHLLQEITELSAVDTLHADYY